MGYRKHYGGGTNLYNNTIKIDFCQNTLLNEAGLMKAILSVKKVFKNKV